ncbi:putative sulfatase [Leeuwenhoekiella aestuarii]|uniref:Putative sulfatase n=1 Tax=Leeuwenhoekiella aestuarii TaxID=2249426 RepID=A0A4Q0NVG2_9FLAO|nr:LTA synthase family protein [Leeuwenhoekiella aestuarii]RXG15721.1 putative sulfatase [Leeuwenhoekiella aestuarii]RXG17170.1 putative sulfatase [Leeuwenhoekiella aestuarii]
MTPDNNTMHTINPNLIYKLKQGLVEFSGYALLLLIGILFCRILELILFQTSQSLPFSFIELLSKGFFTDLLFWLYLLIPTALLFLFFSVISIKAAKVIFNVLFVLFFLVNLQFIYYYKTSLVLLGSDLFGYSINDIKQTIGASGVLAFGTVVLFLVFIAFIILGLIFLKPRLKLNFAFSSVLMLIGLPVFLLGGLPDLKPKYEQDFANNLITNKSQHFYNAAIDYVTQTTYKPDIYADNYLSQLERRVAQQGKFNYKYPDYPFLHDAENSDVLSPFFENRGKKPNLVFIVVEGLGRAFTNEEAYLGNFTPFLDSLSKQSLYFKNFLSNGGRTFAVLPSLLGSEPFAQNGFLALQENMPEQLSMLNMLQRNGYTSAFYYGGDATFDNMSGYLKLNKTTTIFDEKSFSGSYSKLPESGGFSWGYGDADLYDYYLNKSIDDTLAAPRLDILLTVTTHSPFKLKDQNRYNSLFEDRLKVLNLTQQETAQRQNFKEEFATVLYADESLKNLFKNYSKRKDFDNTIFFITGDHRIPEIPLSTKIDRYHVPLIVYSPMLKKAKTINAISSHFDVAPSVLRYLNNSYGIPLPQQTSFLSKGLDTVASFRNTHQIPLMQTKTDLIDFVSETYHLNGNQLYQLYPNLYEEPITDDTKKEELLTAFAEFKRRNQQIAEGKPLIPDSLVTKYAK